MTDLEQTIMRELATLPESRLAEVLDFVRFLKVSDPDKDKIQRDFKAALKDARAMAKKHHITQDDINAEIHAVRKGK